MKVSELFEDREEPFKYSQEEFDALAGPNPTNIEEAFRVQNVAFNQRKGLGGTPNSQNVVYLGFAAEMKPSQFLKVALDADRSDDAKKFVGFIRERAPVASPFLEIRANLREWEEDGAELRVEVKGHEGRGRMWAIDEVNGNTPVPVHFFVLGGNRARHLSEKFFKDFREAGLVKERAGEGAKPTPINFGRIFWNGKTL
jgi:hypothetical protein